MKTAIKQIMMLGLAMGVAACGDQSSEQAETEVKNAGEINIYSARHYDTDVALYEDFTEQTGIQVNLIEAQSDPLIERIANEGELSPADVLITVDAGRLWRAEERGIFRPLDNDVLEERIPAHLRHPDGLWFGISKRARVIVYNKEAGKPEGLNDYMDLADPAHVGKTCIRSSKNIYNISLMASMVSHYGEQKAEEWAKGVVANFAREPQSNDTGQIRAVASGECQIGVANTYYLARLIGSENEEDNNVAASVGVIFPGQEGNGTHVNISGIGITKYAPNADNAEKFLEYLTQESAQRYLAEGNNEYPTVLGTPLSASVAGLGEFKEDTLNSRELGVNQATAVKVYDRAGWQ